MTAAGLRFHSLFTRFALLLLVMQLSLLGTLFGFLYLNTRNAAMELIEKRLATLEVELRAALQSPVLERDLVTLSEIAGELIATGEINYLVVFGPRGEELTRAGLAPVAPLPAAQWASGIDPDFWKHPELHLRFTLIPTTLAVVQLGYRPEVLYALLREQAFSSAWFLGFFAIASFVLSLSFFRRVALRLAVIEKAAAEFSRGKLEVRAPAGSRDEIERLGAAFNAMAEELARQMLALTLAERETHRALASLEQEHAQLTALLEAMRMGVLLVDSNDRVLYANMALRRLWAIPFDARLVGLTAHEAMRASTTRCAEPEHFSRLLLAIPGTQETSDSVELHLADGRILMQLCYPVRDAHERLIGRLWLYEDVTRERRNAEQLIYLAERDGLTGLYNRRHFEELLERTLHEAARKKRRAALLLLDLDEFKHLNDTFGHRAGDALLTRVASELTAITRKHELCARLGGDEFAILVSDLEDENELKALADRVVRGLARIPFDFDQQRIGITVSIGAAIFPDHAETPEDLVIAADVAMYQAKQAGRNTWRFYDGSRNAEEVERLTWNQRIERALQEELFELHFQGIYHLDGRLKHVEALIRMRDPENPALLVPPNRFIPAAERSGKIRLLDRWVVRKALAMLAEHPEAPAIAVNISGKTLDDPEFGSWLEEIWNASPAAARRLTFEITETAAINDLQEALRFADLVHRLGATLCLDDFGAGFSSFTYLKYIPADTVKIDGQFIKDLPRDRSNLLIVRAITQVAQGMGKTTIAEFVEDLETVELLSEIGVDAAQGFFLNRPAPAFPPERLTLPAPASAA